MPKYVQRVAKTIASPGSGGERPPRKSPPTELVAAHGGKAAARGAAALRTSSKSMTSPKSECCTTGEVGISLAKRMSCHLGCRPLNRGLCQDLLRSMEKIFIRDTIRRGYPDTAALDLVVRCYKVPRLVDEEATMYCPAEVPSGTSWT